jgi:hypothetical protein
MRRWNRTDEQRAIGIAVLAARAKREPWKALEERFDRTRRQLWTYACAVSREKVTQQKSEVTHHEPRQLAGAEA